jgi:hypothetical protein
MDFFGGCRALFVAVRTAYAAIKFWREKRKTELETALRPSTTTPPSPWR